MAGVGYTTADVAAAELAAAACADGAAAGLRCWANRVLCFSFSGIVEPFAGAAAADRGVPAPDSIGAAAGPAVAVATRERVLPGEAEADPIRSPFCCDSCCCCGVTGGADVVGGGVAVTRLA